MAAFTTILGGAMMAGGGALKYFSGKAQEKEAMNSINNYERQDLNNLGENIQISTYGSDVIKNETARNIAGMMQNVQQAGSRSIIGATGRIAQEQTRANERAGMYLDNQEQKRQYAMLEDATHIRGLQERREESDLAGYGALYEAGRQTSWSGIGDMMQAGMYGLRQIENNKPVV